ncbi:PREDICTED: pentatricopeptide repeat-containing protein At4g32450, mitochondrial-like [Camelina sativa]|uniref:Pentatricopeptide repeat-containing protein At4g32450, mitochondrial-like n=1 Tax=Camelina sativa TaxID=90675 RepID=A0ABM1QIR1_CAMSA|nr:PREDICTED: pentatricopeptide repeat-containing protein At4g32450, mitochondrial-like [Camelina sativa]
MIYTLTRVSLLGSTRKLRYSSSSSSSSCFSYDSLRCLHPLLRNLSTSAQKLGFGNPNYGYPMGNSSHHIGGDVNGFNVGFHQNSYEQSLNPETCPVSGQNPSRVYQNCSNGYNQNQNRSYGESSETFNQRQQHWQSSCSSYGTGSGVLLQENAGSGSNHFQQDYSGHNSLEELDAICREGNVKTALDIIQSWRNEGYFVDLPRLLWIAELCGDAQALQEAKVVHEFITSSVGISDIRAYNLIIEMYSGCGSVEDALTVFNSMPVRSLETWCAIIRCFAKNGLGEDAVDMFTRFKEEGNRPDGEIFKEIFFACGFVGDINEGLLHFESMIKEYGIIPSMEHYVSLVNMLAAPGYLDEALSFVESMEPHVDLWETLMNLSRVHGDVMLGDRCQDMVEQLDASRLNRESGAGLVPVKSSDLIKERLQRMAKEPKLGIGPMAAGDISRLENREYYMALKSLHEHMVESGYVPEYKIALHDVDQESKAENLFNHHERLAFVWKFLNTPVRSEIRVLKNLRACVDCHNALKLMSTIVGRVLISRDAKRYHHMKDGVCSCGEYW